MTSSFSAKFSAWARPASADSAKTNESTQHGKGDGASMSNANMQPKAYAPKHAENFTKHPNKSDKEKKKRKSHKRNRSVSSHSPTARTRKSKVKAGGGDSVGSVPSVTKETQSPHAANPGKPGIVAPKPPGVPDIPWNGQPTIPPPAGPGTKPGNLGPQKPPAPWNSHQIPLNSQPGPWNKTPYNTTLGGPPAKQPPPPKGLPPNSKGIHHPNPKMDKNNFMDQYMKQSYNYNDNFKQYKPGNPINQPFFNKLKNMKPGEYDDWYSQQYLAWNQAQVKAKISDCLIPIPAQKPPATVEKAKDAKKLDKHPEAHGVTDTGPGSASSMADNRPSPQSHAMPKHEDLKAPGLKRLSEDQTEFSPMMSVLMDKGRNLEESHQPEDSAKGCQSPGPVKSHRHRRSGRDRSSVQVKPLLTDQMSGVTGSVQVKPEQVAGRAVQNDSGDLPFYLYLKEVMMPVMMKGVPESIFYGRDKTTGSSTNASTYDRNPCKNQLDKLLAIYRKTQVSDKEMISIRNNLADCIANNVDYFYVRKGRRSPSR